MGLARRDAVRLAVGAVGLALVGGSRAADAFPTRPVQIVVPFPPGSALDLVTRLVADQLAEKWRQPVVVENIAGGGGNVGAFRFARSEPDGYTLLSSPPGPIALNKVLFKDTNYDATKFAPISLLTTVPNVLVARKSLPATFEAFLAYARANPGKLNYASQGVGSTGFLTARQLELRAGIEMVHVPYRGAAPILADIAAEHVDLFFDTATTSIPLQEGGLARVLATAGSERLVDLGQTPAIAEFFPGFRSTTWFALAGPEGMADDLARKISGDVAAIVASPAIDARLRQIHMTPRGTNVSDTKTFFDDERALWTNLVHEIRLEPQ